MERRFLFRLFHVPAIGPARGAAGEEIRRLPP